MSGSLISPGLEWSPISEYYTPDMEFVWIEPGSFMMCKNDEWNKITISKGFYMQTTPVTQKQWKAVMGNNPSKFKDCDDCPVEMVSWKGAQKFIKKLNRNTGKKYRLPTDAEWEYACRAGSTTAYYYGDNQSQLGDYAWYDYNSDRKTHSVGQKKPNAWGLYDMHGNIWEWVQDKWIPDKKWKDDSTYRVARGGCWIDYPYGCRSEIRTRNTPGYRSCWHGFRLLREIL